MIKSVSFGCSTESKKYDYAKNCAIASSALCSATLGYVAGDKIQKMASNFANKGAMNGQLLKPLTNTNLFKKIINYFNPYKIANKVSMMSTKNVKLACAGVCALIPALMLLNNVLSNKK